MVAQSFVDETEAKVDLSGVREPRVLVEQVLERLGCPANKTGNSTIIGLQGLTQGRGVTEARLGLCM